MAMLAGFLVPTVFWCGALQSKSAEERASELEEKGVRTVSQLSQAKDADNPDRDSINFLVRMPLRSSMSHELPPLAAPGATNPCAAHPDECKHDTDCGKVIRKRIDFSLSMEDLASGLADTIDRIREKLVQDLVADLASSLAFPDTRPSLGAGLGGNIDWTYFTLCGQWDNVGSPHDVLTNAILNSLQKSSLRQEGVDVDIPPCTSVWVRPIVTLKIDFAGTYCGRMTEIRDREGVVHASRIGPGFIFADQVDVKVAVDSKKDSVRTCECKKIGRLDPPIKDIWDGPWEVAVAIECPPGRYRITRPRDPACDETIVEKDRNVQVATASPAQATYTFTGTGERSGDHVASAVEAPGDKPIVQDRPLVFTARGDDHSFLVVEGNNGTAMELDPVMVNAETGEVVYATPCVSPRLARAEEFRVVQMNEDLTPGLSSVFENGARSNPVGFRFGFGIGGRRGNAPTKSAPCPEKQ